MKLEKKHYYIGGALAIISVFAGLAYLQYKKIMQYCISLKGVKLNTLKFNLVDLNLALNFKNNSDVKFVIKSQEHDVYIDNIFVTKISSQIETVVEPNKTNVISVNVQLNPKEVFSKLGKNALTLATNIDKIVLKVESKMRVKLWAFTIPIKYTYLSTFKELTTPTPKNEAIENTKC